LCANDEPIYHFIVYNESKLIEFGGNTLSDGVEATFYLHYQPTYLFSTDNETTPFWMITKDEISVNYLAKCMEEDLMDCTANKWNVKVTEWDGDLNGMIEEILDLGMTVTDGACNTEGVQMEEDKSSTGTVVAVLLVLLALCVCIGGFIMWRKMNKNEAMKLRDQIHGQHSVPTGTGAEEAEPDVEVQTIETAGNVTTTQD